MSLRVLSLAAAFALTAGSASAATTGFTLVLSGDTNVPTFTLTNDSDAALLTNFTFTIGDTTRNFDGVTSIVSPSGGIASLVSPDANTSGGVRTDQLELNFTGFDPSESASFLADVDRDSANTVEDFRTVFFNNGSGVPNSIMSALFSNGLTAFLTLPHGPTNANAYTFSTVAPAVIPVPAALPLLLSALGLMVVAGFRRRPLVG